MISTQYISRISLQRDKVESFDRYPFSLSAVRSLETLELHPKMTFFVGENGQLYMRTGPYLEDDGKFKFGSN